MPSVSGKVGSAQPIMFFCADSLSVAKETQIYPSECYVRAKMSIFSLDRFLHIVFLVLLSSFSYIIFPHEIRAPS